MDDRPFSPAPATAVPARSLVIGTAGHIDHGKTALIRALTGVDADRLPEEKRRGITIDLGFASLALQAADGSPIHLGFIDVPGHARFVRNMLAGAGGIDAVLLVISAEEGVKPQTEEHLAICSLLGIERGLAVLTKIDAVACSRLEDTCSSVKRSLSGTFLGSAPLLRVSAYTGEGLDALRAELAALAASIPRRNADSLPRLPLDRTFVMPGFGTVVTGTLVSGSLHAGQELEIEPGGRAVRARGIQVHGSAADCAESPTRVAINLSRIESSEIKRGDTLIQPSTMVAVNTIDVEIELLKNAPILKHRSTLHFHAFTSECMAAVSLYEERSLEPGHSGLARLRLDKPIVLLPQDRFVLRHGSPLMTVGGGRVLDAHPLPHLKRPVTGEWLQLLRDAALDQQLVLRIQRCGTAGATVIDLMMQTGLQTESIRERLARFIQDGSLIALSNGLFLTREAMEEAVHSISSEFNKLSPQCGPMGVKRSELRSLTRLAPDVFDYAMRVIERDGIVRTEDEYLFSCASEPGAASSDQLQLQQIDHIFETAGLAPPSPNHVAAELRMDEKEMRRFITILLRERKLVRLGSDALCVHQHAIAQLQAKLQVMRGQNLDIARFKEMAGVSRKFAIPLLEYLDRERITRKQGDVRVVL